jgi:HSP20 family molecular chaperone IbpA
MSNFPVAPFGSNSYNPWNFGGVPESTWLNPWTAAGPVTPYGGDFDRTFRTFNRDFNSMNRWMDRTFRNLERTFSSELNFQPSRPANMLEHYSLMNPIRIDAEGNRWLNCYFDMRSFKPEEVSVTLDSKNRFLNVEANHEVKDSKDHYIKRSYSRKVYIPDDLKVDLSKLDLKSCLTNEGLLCVEAALPKLSLEEARSPATSKSLSTVNPSVYSIPVKTI